MTASGQFDIVDRQTVRCDVIRIDAPHFCAGLVLGEDMIVERTAPILRYMIRWPATRVVTYCQRKGWRWEMITPSS